MKNKKNVVTETYNYSNRRKQVLQNKPVTFRPTDNQLLEFKNKEKLGISKTEIIKTALDFRKDYEDLPVYFILELMRKHPEISRIAWNRHKNELKKGQLIYGKPRQRNLKVVK